MMRLWENGPLGKNPHSNLDGEPELLCGFHIIRLCGLNLLDAG